MNISTGRNGPNEMCVCEPQLHDSRLEHNKTPPHCSIAQGSGHVASALQMIKDRCTSCANKKSGKRGLSGLIQEKHRLLHGRCSVFHWISVLPPFSYDEGGHGTDLESSL